MITAYQVRIRWPIKATVFEGTSVSLHHACIYIHLHNFVCSKEEGGGGEGRKEGGGSGEEGEGRREEGRVRRDKKGAMGNIVHEYCPSE